MTPHNNVGSSAPDQLRRYSVADIVIRQVPLDAVVPLRHRILRPQEGAESTLIDEDRSPDAVHYGAYIGSTIIGTLSIVPQRFPHYPYEEGGRLRGLATVPEVRGQGVASLLLSRVVEEARLREVKLIWAFTRLRAVALHTRIGFEPVGDVFEYPGTGPHQLILHRAF